MFILFLWEYMPSLYALLLFLPLILRPRFICFILFVCLRKTQQQLIKLNKLYLTLKTNHHRCEWGSNICAMQIYKCAALTSTRMRNNRTRAIKLAPKLIVKKLHLLKQPWNNTNSAGKRIPLSRPLKWMRHF